MDTSSKYFDGRTTLRSFSNEVVVTYGFSSKRFLLLLIFMLSLMCNQLGYYFDNLPNYDYIQYFALFFYIPFFYSSVILIEIWGLNLTMIIALSIQTVGLFLGNALQFTLDYSISDLIGSTVGEVLNSIALVYMMNAVTKFSGLWFGTRGRITATALLLMSFHIGQYIGVWVIEPELNYKMTTSVRTFWFVASGISLGLLILTFFFFSNEPYDTPCLSQSYYRKNPFVFKEGIQGILSDEIVKKGFFISAGLLTYIYCSPYNFYWYRFEGSDHLAFDYIQPPCYILGILFFAILLTRKFDFKRVFLFGVLMNFIFTIITEISYMVQSVGMLFLGYLFQGLFLGGLKLLIYEFITEISYPVSPGLVIGLLHAFANFPILFMTVVSDTLADANVQKYFLHVIQWLFILLMPLSGYFILKFQFRVKRLEIDQQINSNEY